MRKKVYEQKLIDFEPKIRGMVRNCRMLGYPFHGHDDDDLTNEMFLKGLQIREKFQPEKAQLTTWLYTCFRFRLLKIAEKDTKAFLWGVRLSDIDEDNDSHPVLIQKIDWRVEAAVKVEKMIDDLWGYDPVLARICQSLRDNRGNKSATRCDLGISRPKLEYELTKLRSWSGVNPVLDTIPF